MLFLLITLLVHHLMILSLDNLLMKRIGVSMNNTELQFEKFYLDSLKIVMNHSAQEDLLFTYGKGLKKIASDLDGNIKLNQGVDIMTPPEAPIVTIQAKDIYINFSLNRIEVGLKGSRKHIRNDDL